MKVILRIALVLVIIGAINWGLIGFFNYDLVASITGRQDSFFARIIYSLVGISGLICIALLFRDWDGAETRTSRQLNYGTEFGEEEDFDEFYR